MHLKQIIQDLLKDYPTLKTLFPDPDFFVINSVESDRRVSAELQSRILRLLEMNETNIVMHYEPWEGWDVVLEFDLIEDNSSVSITAEVETNSPEIGSTLGMILLGVLIGALKAGYRPVCYDEEFRRKKNRALLAAKLAD